FPNSVPGVIFQSGQFGYSRAYLNSITPNSKAMAAAKYVFLQHGSTLPKKVLFYRAAYLGTEWTDYTKYYATIEGNCYFYGIKYF
ncbi:MAG: cell wall hydrolase, partial [Christensenellales bacterium]